MNINGMIIIGNWLKCDIWANISDFVVLIQFQMTHRQNLLGYNERDWFNWSFFGVGVCVCVYVCEAAVALSVDSRAKLFLQPWFCPLPPTNKWQLYYLQMMDPIVTFSSGLFFLLFERELLLSAKFLLKQVCDGWLQFQASAVVHM